MNSKVLVVLLTYGEPDNHRFLEHYRYSLSILRRLTRLVARIPSALMPLMAGLRAWKRVGEWSSHDYVSPLEAVTRGQALGLQERLGNGFEVEAAYEFRSPGLESVLDRVRRDPPRALVLLPLYAADCDLTTGLSRSLLRWNSLRQGDLPCPVDFVSGFDRDPALLALTEAYFKKKLAEAGWQGKCSEAALILGCHGTVLQAPGNLDAGLAAFQGLYADLSRRLGSPFAEVTVGWMNHKRGGPWTQPDLETAVRSLVSKGIRRAVYYPYGFLADADETTHESRHIFEKFPELEVLHLPCLNDDPAFLDYLASRIRGRGQDELDEGDAPR